MNNKRRETPTKERKKSLLFECQCVSPELAILPVLLKLWEMRNSIGFVACIVRSWVWLAFPYVGLSFKPIIHKGRWVLYLFSYIAMIWNQMCNVSEIYDIQVYKILPLNQFFQENSFFKFIDCYCSFQCWCETSFLTICLK